MFLSKELIRDFRVTVEHYQEVQEQHPKDWDPSPYLKGELEEAFKILDNIPEGVRIELKRC